MASRAAADTTKAAPTKATADVARAQAQANPATQQMQSRAAASVPDARAATATADATAADAAKEADKAKEAKAAEEAKAAPTEAEKAFEAVKAGVSMKSMPKEVQLPGALDAGMQKAWSNSLPGGKSQEQGGITVEKKDGTYEFRDGKPGTAGSFSTNYGDVKPGEKVVAAAHTHPYDKTEGGFTDVSFSGTDLANSVNKPDVVRTVQSGNKQFAAVPSQEFKDRVAGLDTAGKTALHKEMTKAFDTALASATGDFPARVDAAVRAVANTYGLGYYAGTNGLLTRQP